VSAPSLSVTSETNHQLKISWPTTATGFALKQTDDLTPPVHWVTVTNNPVVANGQFVVTIPANGGRSFYRLNFE
jgi:hypothetical protein